MIFECVNKEACTNFELAIYQYSSEAVTKTIYDYEILKDIKSGTIIKSNLLLDSSITRGYYPEIYHYIGKQSTKKAILLM
jgi:hypothetical protein